VVTLFQTLHTLAYVAGDRMKALKDEKGASAVEYAVLVGVLVAAIAVAVGLFGNKIAAAFNGLNVGGGATPAPTTAPKTT
jgi:pilus assembly protein Flp/PilA